jgi:hypothetical protein
MISTYSTCRECIRKLIAVCVCSSAAVSEGQDGFWWAGGRAGGQLQLGRSGANEAQLKLTAKKIANVEYMRSAAAGPSANNTGHWPLPAKWPITCGIMGLGDPHNAHARAICTLAKWPSAGASLGGHQVDLGLMKHAGRMHERPLCFHAAIAHSKRS